MEFCKNFYDVTVNFTSSLFHQPIPSPVEVVLSSLELIEPETVHQWSANNFVVYLIKKQDALGNVYLEYKTTKNEIEIYADTIELLENEDIEEAISHLKTCKAMIDENGVVGFLTNYHTWECDSNIEISLTRGREGLVWNIFQKITKESTFYPFQEATIPSLRCHPDTIALIEKAKTEAFCNPQLLHCLIKDFKVKVIDPESLKSILYAEMKKNAIESFWLEDTNFSTVGTIAFTLNLFNYYLLKGLAFSTVRSVRGFFGGGVLGTVAGVYAGFGVLAPIGILNMIITTYGQGIHGSSYWDSVFDKKQKTLEEKIVTLPFQNPLLIEIEPISAPSVIDERVYVSKFTWAVTLITHKGSEGNHARIVAEGINDGFYDEEAPRIGPAKKVGIGEKFIHLADYSPQIQSGLLSPDALEYETRTEIFMVPSDEVKKMLEAIKKEEYIRTYRRPFNFWGKSSKFYRLFSDEVGDNCFTWARDKLKLINIDLGAGYTDLVIAVARNYTRQKKDYKILPFPAMI